MVYEKMSCGNVADIQIINKAIPPSQPLQFSTPGYHGSSKSLNLMIGYKTTPQYPLQAIDTRSQRDISNLTAYTGELNYSAVPGGSNRNLHSLYTAHEGNVNKPFMPSRQNSIVYAYPNPRYSAYSYPHTIVLNQAPSDLEKAETKVVPQYGKLAWLACLFFFPLGLIALKKHYETRKYRYKNPDKAIAAADVTRFLGTFSILLGIVLFVLAIAIRLRISYEDGDDFA